MSGRVDRLSRPGWWRPLAIACLLAVAAPASLSANDSSAELTTGGLVFAHNPAVTMRSEDLFISSAQIRVRYVFLNNGPRDVTSTVAFPLPDITVDSSDANIAVPTEDPRNLVGFTTSIDGRPVAARVEQKVFARGDDQTAVLRELGLPLAPHLKVTYEALDRLPPDKWRKLIALGLAATTEYDIGGGMKQHLEPRWTLKTAYYWRQTFPPGRELVVEHRYKPSVGESVPTALGRPDFADFAIYQRRYCIDPSFMAAVARARQAAKNGSGAPFREQRIQYILSTGANWAGPIGDFTLTVDKGHAASLVSFCAEGVKKISPTRFRAHYTDFTPRTDLAILILTPLDRR